MVAIMASAAPAELSPHDRQRISAAIQAAERRTTGEIVCVLARSSVEATALPIVLAALAALALPWLLVGLTTLPVLIMLSLQLALFVALAMLLCLPRVRAGLLPAATRRAITHRMAMEQFVLRGIGRTEGRTGVLVFVSLAERYARIVADEAIASRVAQAEWQHAVDALIDHMRQGRIADGFVEAIDRCGGVLATHFPARPDERSELPDRIYLI
jgi:putative membrane protein